MSARAGARTRAAPFGVALFVCGALAGGCASVDRDAAPAIAVPEVPLPAGLVDEIVPLTAELIRQRAQNPPGDEARVVDVLASRLRAAGIAVDVRPFDGPTRTNLLAVLDGEDDAAPPFILLGHTDVVPADPAEWQRGAGPFDGVVAGGALVGRGALDMLSMDALMTLALIALRDADVPLRRDVALVLTGDEEVAGRGVQAAMEAWPDVFRQGAVALSEGSFAFQSLLAPGEDIAAIAVAEKGLFQFRLRAIGPSGHGSTPLKDAAPDRLVRATTRVLGLRSDLVVTPPTARMFQALGVQRGGVEGAVLRTPPLLLLLSGERFAASPTTRAILTDTCALTVLRAGGKDNVIPGSAEATFDCRLLPGTDPARFRDDVLLAIDDPKVELTVLTASAANGSPPEAPLIDAIRARMKREAPATIVAPVLSRGATDGRFLRAAGIATYGFVPIRITGAELDTLHGANERVRVDELERALPRLVDIVAAVAAR